MEEMIVYIMTFVASSIIIYFGIKDHLENEKILHSL